MSTASLMSTEPSSRVIRFSIDLLVAFDYHAGALEQMSELLEVAVRVAPSSLNHAAHLCSCFCRCPGMRCISAVAIYRHGSTGAPNPCRMHPLRTARLFQLVEQRLCLSEIGGGEALGEPAVDRG